MVRGLWCPIVLAALVLTGCILELDAELACGDGHVDRRPEAGEECDPGDERSYIGACSEVGSDRPGACDPMTCQIDFSVCIRCGNGIVEPDHGEECDPEADLDALVLATGKPCEDIDNDGPVEYAGGFSRACLDDCTWDRRDCHFCGDEQRRVEEPFSEYCDGLDYLPEEKADFCWQKCVTDVIDPAPTAVKCQARCRPDCNGFEVPPDGRRCCLPSGETVSPQIPCCNPPAPGDPTICGPGFEVPDE